MSRRRRSGRPAGEPARPAGGSTGTGASGSPGSSGTESSGTESSGAGSGASGSSTGGSPARKREPRIGRRTIPPDAAATPPRASGSSTTQSSGKKGSGGGASDGAATTPARPRAGSLRSAGARTGSTAAKPARTTPARSAAEGDERRRGGGLFSAFRAPSVYPKLGETYAAGARAVLGSPVVVLGSMLLVLAMWFGLLAVGLGHVPQFFQNLLAIPPLSSFFDLNVAFNALGLTLAAALLALAITAVRAVIWAILTSLVVERLDSGRISSAGVMRGLRSTPAFLGIFIVEVALIYFSQLLRVVLGTSFGGLAFFAALVGGLHFLVFAPIIVIRDGATARAALGQSTRAARLPGARHVGMVLLYFTGAFLLPSFVPMTSAFTVNPTLVTWSLVLAVTLFHLVSLGGFAYRYGVIEEDVPPPAPRRARSRTSMLGRR